MIGIHVYPSDGTWAVRRSGGARALRGFRKMDAAIEFALDVATRLRANLYIHDSGGRIVRRIAAGSFLANGSAGPAVLPALTVLGGVDHAPNAAAFAAEG